MLLKSGDARPSALFIALLGVPAIGTKRRFFLLRGPEPTRICLLQRRGSDPESYTLSDLPWTLK